MESKPGLKISVLLIIASMSMLASSDIIPPEIPYDLPTCVEAIKGCFYEIHQFKRCILSGVLPQPGSGLIGPACCAAIMEIHEKCWLFVFPDPFFTPQLQSYCTRQSQMAPAPGPDPDDTPLAPAPASDPDTPAPAPAPAPQVDPPAPVPAPEVDPPAPAPAPAPKVDPPAPAPAPKDDPPVPAPAPAPKDDPPAPAPACVPRRHHGHGGDLSEKWYCT